MGGRVWVDVEDLEDSGGRSPLNIEDIDIYAQSPTNTRSPTLNSEEPVWLFIVGCGWRRLSLLR